MGVEAPEEGAQDSIVSGGESHLDRTRLSATPASKGESANIHILDREDKWCHKRVSIDFHHQGSQFQTLIYFRLIFM